MILLPFQNQKTRYQAGLITGFLSLVKNTMASSGPVALGYLPGGGATGKVQVSLLP